MATIHFNFYNRFDSLLRSNGYSEEFIHKTYNTNRSIPRNTQSIEWFYLKIPFVNDRINWGLRSIFRSEGIPVRFYHQNKSLRNILKPKMQSHEICTCPFNSICYQKNIVYEVKCLLCQQIYIGSTIRILHTRLYEHITRNSSSIYRHLQTCSNVATFQRMHSRIAVRVLAHDKDTINLRIKEAIFIKHHRPLLNAREELNELTLLI